MVDELDKPADRTQAPTLKDTSYHLSKYNYEDKQREELPSIISSEKQFDQVNPKSWGRGQRRV